MVKISIFTILQPTKVFSKEAFVRELVQLVCYFVTWQTGTTAFWIVDTTWSSCTSISLLITQEHCCKHVTVGHSSTRCELDLSSLVGIPSFLVQLLSYSRCQNHPDICYVFHYFLISLDQPGFCLSAAEKEKRHVNRNDLPKQDVQQEVNRRKICDFNSSRELDLVFRLRCLSCSYKRLEVTCSLFRAGLTTSICWYLSENVGIIWFRNDGTFLTHHLPEERRSERLWNVDGFLKTKGEISIARMVPFYGTISLKMGAASFSEKLMPLWIRRKKFSPEMLVLFFLPNHRPENGDSGYLQRSDLPYQKMLRHNPADSSPHSLSCCTLTDSEINF